MRFLALPIRIVRPGVFIVGQAELTKRFPNLLRSKRFLPVFSVDERTSQSTDSYQLANWFDFGPGPAQI